MTVVFVVLGSSLIILNPFQTKFSVYQKTLDGKANNFFKTGFVIETKYLKIVHGTVVNGVQGRMSLFITLQSPIFRTGSNDVYFKGSCLIASSLTNNDNLYQLPLFIAWLRFSRILQFSCLKPGGFTWVVTPCKERDDPRYAWENITFFRSRWKLASLSSSKVIHLNFHYYG